MTNQPKTVDLSRFFSEAPKEGGIPISARVSPDTKAAISRIIAMQVTQWQKESDFVRAAVHLLLREVQPLFTDGKDSVAEDIRLINLHTERARRLARRYDHDAFVQSTLHVALKCLANDLGAEAVDELTRSYHEALRIHPKLADRLRKRVEVEPKLADAWQAVLANEKRRVESAARMVCEVCGHPGKAHGIVNAADGEEHPGCGARGCGCDDFVWPAVDEEDE